MAEATTQVEPNLYQLAVELGDPDIGFRMVGPDVVDGTYRLKTDAVEQGALELAIAAHLPNPAIVPPSTAQDAQRATNRGLVEQRITEALAELDAIVNYPAVDTVPTGTLTTAQLSNVARAMRTAIHENRVGIQRVAALLHDTIRLVRGDFDNID
jgi:hypothetical protein